MPVERSTTASGLSRRADNPGARLYFALGPVLEGGNDWSRPSALARATIMLEIPAPQGFLARRGLGHRIPARIAHLCHVRFYAGSDTAGARHNTSTQFRNIGLAYLSGHRHREHAILASWRQLGQMRFYAGLDPAFAGFQAIGFLLFFIGQPKTSSPPAPLRTNTEAVSS